MIRRSLTIAACLVLGAVAVPASAATPLKACPKFSDAVGDSALTLDEEQPPLPTVPIGPVKDAALDITSVVFKPAGKGLAMAITVDKYADRPTYSLGNRYQVEFTAGHDDYVVYYKNSVSRDVEGKVYYQSGVKQGGTFVHSDVTATYVGNTITLLLSKAALTASFGPKAVGSKITQMRATAYASYGADNEYFDKAAAPSALSYVIGAACR